MRPIVTRNASLLSGAETDREKPSKDRYAGTTSWETTTSSGVEFGRRRWAVIATAAFAIPDRGDE